MPVMAMMSLCASKGREQVLRKEQILAFSFGFYAALAQSLMRLLIKAQ